MSQWNVKMLVDYREKYIKEFFTKNREYDKIVEIRNLEIGDIIIEINDYPTILIERKTMKDLASSITDGRLREQKYRIASSTIPKNKIFYLIEGELDEKLYGRVDKKTLQGSLINTMLRDDYKVYRTKDPRESVYFLVRLLSKIISDKHKLIKYNQESYTSEIQTTSIQPQIQESDQSEIQQPQIQQPQQPKMQYCETLSLSKKGNMTPQVFNQVIFLQIPGISTNIISEIQKEYPYARDLILKYESLEHNEDRADLLSNIKISLKTGKTRKLGFIISKRIYDFFYPDSLGLSQSLQ
jgi:crossover junction endonuclease MUS81